MGNCTCTPEAPASAWLIRFSPLIGPRTRVLEIACGNGRNTRFLSSLGCHVTAVDRNVPPVIADGVLFEQMDLEQGSWPLAGRSYDAVVGINYLYRPHFADLCANVAPGGFLLYETFTGEQLLGDGQRRNRAHFLQHGELLQMIPSDWRIVAFEDGMSDAGNHLERLLVRRPDACAAHTISRLCCPR